MGLLKHMKNEMQLSQFLMIKKTTVELPPAFKHEHLILNARKQMENLLEQTATSRWEQNWLRLYGKNPVVLAETAIDVKTLMGREEYAGMSEEAVAADYGKIQEAEALVDIDAISRMSWDDMSNELQRIRNFTEYEQLSESELDLLDYGCFMIYKVDVPKFSVLFGEKKAMEPVREVPTTLCFIKNESSVSMHILYQDSTEPTIENPFGAKNWIYRNKNVVSFYLGENLLLYSINFDSAENAESFESSFMFLAEFADNSTVIRLYGEFAAQQLIYKGFTGTNKNRHPHVDYLKELMKNTSPEEHTPYQLNSTNDKLIETLRKRMAAYVKYTYDLHVFLFKSSISIENNIVMGNNIMIVELLKDQKTLERILAFSTRNSNEIANQSNVVSFSKLNLHLSFIFHNLICCCMMRFVFNTYYLSQDHLFSALINVRSSIIDQWQNEYKETGNQQQMDMNNLHVMNIVKDYFASCQGLSDFPEFFLRLDKILRVGDRSVFEVIDKEFRKELTNDLFFSKTYFGFHKEFFDDRSSVILTNILSRSNAENVVSIGEITDWSLSAVDSHNFRALSVAEDFVCEIVPGCICILRTLSENIEQNVLHFEIEEWRKYVAQAATISRAVNVSNEQGNTTQGISLPGSSSLPCESEWKKYNNYDGSEFKEIASLGGGAYGYAMVLEHPNLFKVVLKQYNNYATDDDRKREIDMLIRLQKNDYIVKFIGFFHETKDDFGSMPAGILLEYVERNLHSFIHDLTKTKETFQYIYRYRTAIEQMRGMASAFDAMHNQGIMHRDVKPDNVLLTYGDKIKICDLGMCGNLDKTMKSNTAVGTPRYTAPEIMELPLNYNEKIDVFSLGVTMWEQIHRKTPYWKIESNSDVLDFVCNGNRMEFDDDCPPELKNIIQMAWSQNPVDRPKMEQLEFRLKELLKSSFDEDLQKEVLGPYEKVVVAGSVFYKYKEEKQ